MNANRKVKIQELLTLPDMTPKMAYTLTKKIIGKRKQKEVKK